MKKSLGTIARGLLVTSTAVLLALGFHFASGASPASAPLGAATAPVNPTVRTSPRFENRIGPVRVVLLRARTRASNNGSKEFVVTYGVGIPRKGAFSDLVFSSYDELAVLAHGKPIDLSGCTSSSLATGFEGLPVREELLKPETPEGELMIFQDIVLGGLEPGTRQLDFQMRFKWRGSPMRFDFKDVPVGYANGVPGKRGDAAR